MSKEKLPLIGQFGARGTEAAPTHGKGETMDIPDEYQRAIDEVRRIISDLETDEDPMAVLVDRRLATSTENPAEVAARIRRMSDAELMTALMPDVGRPN